ncbi:rCG34515, isoform CRA_b [Rattus norvegicus]|nr:rCG34515, isoform CRA_b [Rattus norvegicus]EDM06885.1 rCG34515, isoform CRA_b [Rattus norvegicus]EDM06886.1 rCG34515, isoform CRA_b [Rattus norvegicus]EDM06887.1 rCG34515, isoform CRA_b [Rattus norvegicus]
MGRSQQLFPFLAIASQSPCETGAGKGEPAASRHSPCPAPPHPTPTLHYK